MGRDVKKTSFFLLLREYLRTSVGSRVELKVVTPLGTNFHLMVLQRQKQVVNSIEFIFRLVLATNIQMLSVGQETKTSQRAYYC